MSKGLRLIALAGAIGSVVVLAPAADAAPRRDPCKALPQFANDSMRVYTGRGLVCDLKTHRHRKLPTSDGTRYRVLDATGPWLLFGAASSGGEVVSRLNVDTGKVTEVGEAALHYDLPSVLLSSSGGVLAARVNTFIGNEGLRLTRSLPGSTAEILFEGDADAIDIGSIALAVDGTAYWREGDLVRTAPPPA